MMGLLVLWGLLSCTVASLSIRCEYSRAQHIKEQATLVKKESRFFG
jgi:hypothetical protein